MMYCYYCCMMVQRDQQVGRQTRQTCSTGFTSSTNLCCNFSRELPNSDTGQAAPLPPPSHTHTHTHTHTYPLSHSFPHSPPPLLPSPSPSLSQMVCVYVAHKSQTFKVYYISLCVCLCVCVCVFVCLYVSGK